MNQFSCGLFLCAMKPTVLQSFSILQHLPQSQQCLLFFCSGFPNCLLQYPAVCYKSTFLKISDENVTSKRLTQTFDLPFGEIPKRIAVRNFRTFVKCLSAIFRKSVFEIFRDALHMVLSEALKKVVFRLFMAFLVKRRLKTMNVQCSKRQFFGVPSPENSSVTPKQKTYIVVSN